ncbi:unnamed protein product, partial [Meganyctiphanes norvegica]
MDLRMFLVDAFTNTRFSGNPAAVVLLQQKLPDKVLLNVTREFNQAETAFLEPLALNEEGTGVTEDSCRLSNRFGLRWFTPTGEIVLCGHATLAAAHVLFQCLGNESSLIKFSSLSGTLLARRSGSHIVLDFPANDPIPLTTEQEEALGPLVEEVRGGLHVVEVLHSPALKYLMVRLDDSTTRTDLESLHPDSSKLLSLHDGSGVKGIIVTVKGAPTSGEAAGNGTNRGFGHYHVASRFFAPWFGFLEDHVTGSAHTVLGPYWSEKLNTKSLTCRQCSPRGGDIEVTVREDGRIDLAGHSVTLIYIYISL